MEDIKYILVVSRMTKYCEKTVHYGVSLAKKYGAALTLVHVVHDPFGIEGWNLPMPNLDKDYQYLLKKSRRNWIISSRTKTKAACISMSSSGRENRHRKYWP